MLHRAPVNRGTPMQHSFLLYVFTVRISNILHFLPLFIQEQAGLIADSKQFFVMDRYF